jgi:hypothetical protein
MIVYSANWPVIPFNSSTTLGGGVKVEGKRGLRLAARLLETTLPQASTTGDG